MVNQAKRRRIAVNEGMTLVRMLRSRSESVKQYVDLVSSGSGSVEELEKLVAGYKDIFEQIQNANRG